MENSNLEKETKKTFRALLDYYNSLSRFSAAKDANLANNKWIDGLNNPKIKDGSFRLDTLDERFEKGISEYPTKEEFYIQHSGLDTDQDKKVFFEKKNNLDLLVEKFNEELKKEYTDTKMIKQLYQEIENIIGQI